jgi:hypothetical protein
MALLKNAADRDAENDMICHPARRKYMNSSQYRGTTR